MDLIRSRSNRRSVSNWVSPGPRKSDTALLALKVRPPPNKAGRHMLKLSQLHLELTFMGTGTLSENIQDNARAIEHTTASAHAQCFVPGWG